MGVKPPVVIACSFPTRNQDAKFNDEYIIPNLLLQWTLKNDMVNGIRFSSVQYFNKDFNERLINYVLPPVSVRNNYCEKLKSFFEVTPPQLFAVLTYGPNVDDLVAYQTVKGDSAEYAMLNVYKSTTFYKVEGILKELPHFEINEN